VTLYLDTSALLKRYVDEPDGDHFAALLESDNAWLSCRLTWVEVWRNLGRRLDGRARSIARDGFALDWSHIDVVEIDDALCRDAGHVADATGARSLDALHLAALRRAGPGGITLATADLRQAQAARTLGLAVVGA
jgi:predicted nucleic acid-binding protein